uniref:Ovule protein n=1 Tax=Heterorhabditis bacteriophora TaxID=37862 RepID=A0A1I7WI69_HETBA
MSTNTIYRLIHFPIVKHQSRVATYHLIRICSLYDVLIKYLRRSLLHDLQRQVIYIKCDVLYLNNLKKLFSKKTTNIACENQKIQLCHKTF